jgi:hypothetical protein
MKNIKLSAMGVVGGMFICSQAFADFSHQKHRPDGHAPLGVMRDHVHGKGEYMTSYRFGYMFMDDNYLNSSSVSDSEVLGQYMMAPTEMTMKMHMIGGMYGVSDRLTVGLMMNYQEKEMDHINAMGKSVLQVNSGFGDSSINGMYQFFKSGLKTLQFNFGLSIPTGSINERTNSNPSKRVAYPMQHGSGTFDLLPGVSFSNLKATYSYGAQLNAVLRTGESKYGYTQGDRLQATAWLSKNLNDSFSVSGRLNTEIWDDVEGRDSAVMFGMAPPTDPNLQAGEKIELFAGVNYLVKEGSFEGHRLAVEFGAPVYQRLDRYRLATEYKFTIGWQKAF